MSDWSDLDTKDAFRARFIPKEYRPRTLSEQSRQQEMATDGRREIHRPEYGIVEETILDEWDDEDLLHSNTVFGGR